MTAPDPLRDLLAAADVTAALRHAEALLRSDTVKAPDDVIRLCQLTRTLRRAKNRLEPEPFEIPGDLIESPGYSVKAI